jgi:hypothetical protein
MNIKDYLKEITLLLSLILFFQIGDLKADLYRPFLQIQQTSHVPIIDGRLDDACWSASSQISNFQSWTLRTYAEEQVTAFMTYDDKNIYFAFRCLDSHPERLQQTRAKRAKDTFLWGGDYVSVAFGKSDFSFQVMADPKGTVDDWKNGDMFWNGPWKVETRIDSTGWTAEMSISFKELGIFPPTAAEKWSVSFSHNHRLDGDVSWDGEVVFSDLSAFLCQPGRWPAPQPGQNSLQVELFNTAAQPLKIRAEIELIPFEGEPAYVNQEGQGTSSKLELSVRKSPQNFQQKITLQPGKVENHSVKYLLNNEGSFYATFTIFRSSDNSLLHRSRGFWFVLPRNRALVQNLLERLGQARANLIWYPPDLSAILKQKAKNLEEQLTRVKHELDPAWNNGSWDLLYEKIQQLEFSINRFYHQVNYVLLKRMPPSDNRFGLLAVHCLEKIPPDALMNSSFKPEVSIDAARNEYESFQVVIMPFEKTLTDISIEVSELKTSTNAVIPQKNITVSKVDFLNIDYDCGYEVDRRGWWPDPLMTISGPFDIPKQRLCQPVWVTIHVPEDIPAGMYSGTITVTTADAGQESLPISLRVWDFDMPVQGHLFTHTWDEVGAYARFYNLKEYPLEWYLRICDLLLKNRLNPGSSGYNYVRTEPAEDGQYDFSKEGKILQFCKERGMTRFSMIQLRKGKYTPEEEAKIYPFIKAYADFLRQHGWLDEALVELWDEPLLHEWPDVKARAQRIRAIAPDLKLQVFASEGPFAFWTEESKTSGARDLIDIWAPIPPVESPEIQAEGGEIWSYFATLARGVAPNFYINRPAIYQRTIGWFCWMYHLNGFEHWSINSMERNIHPGEPLEKKWPNVPWDARSYSNMCGEGMFVYPGPEGKPIPSLRLELFRESMEDYEYLYRLAELLKQAGEKPGQQNLSRYEYLLEIDRYLLWKYPADVRTTLENAIRDPGNPEKLLESRYQIAEAIEELQRSLMK